MNFRKLYYLLIGCALFFTIGLTACMNRSTEVSSNNNTKEKDSIVYQAINTDPNHALLIVDSLEDHKLIPEHKANYYRGQIHFKLGQELTAELYYKRSLTGGALYQEFPALYYFVCDQLTTILTNKGDQDGAITIATEAYAKVQEDSTYEGRHWGAILLQKYLVVLRTVEGELCRLE